MNPLKDYNYYPGKHRRGILQSKGHNHVLITSPFHRKSGLVSILLCDSYLMYPNNPSIKEYISWPPTFSSTTSVNGVVNGSSKHVSFNFLRSTQILITHVFLECTTIRLIHSDSSTSSIILSTNILSISAFTFSLYLRFIL
jgi:hypothetical protein